MIVSADIEAYARAHSTPESELLEALAAETRATMEFAGMMVGPLEGGLLSTLVRGIGARRALEIGTFTGYSALWIASALPADGTLIACDNDPVSTELARRYWGRSEHGSKIRLELGDALDTLKTVEAPLDFVFIDADKGNYINYWEACVPMVRRGGVIAVDNVLWSGKVLSPREPTDQSLAAFNAHAAQDDRVYRVMLTVRDGILVATKK